MKRLLLHDELLLVVASLALVVGHAALVPARTARSAPGLVAGAPALAEATETSSYAGAPEDIRALRRAEQVRLVTSFSATLAGGRLERLREVAYKIGVLVVAARRCRSRLWWRGSRPSGCSPSSVSASGRCSLSLMRSEPVVMDACLPLARVGIPAQRHDLAVGGSAADCG
jgi:hypothetical protein